VKSVAQVVNLSERLNWIAPYFFVYLNGHVSLNGPVVFNRYALPLAILRRSSPLFFLHIFDFFTAVLRIVGSRFNSCIYAIRLSQSHVMVFRSARKHSP
jgi:hypothetical protein